MNHYLEAVKEFHEKFNHPVNDKESEIPLDLRQLRIKLLFEELHELAEATDCRSTFEYLCGQSRALSQDGEGQRDKKEEIDALCDIQYVLSGAILSMGHHENFDKAFDEVQRSNMSKMCSTLQEAEDTKQWYVERDGTESYIEENGDKWIVLRSGDNKILKNKYYSPADLKQFV